MTNLFSRRAMFALIFTVLSVFVANAEKKLINISTDNTSMILVAEDGKEVWLHHYGGRVDDASASLMYHNYRRSDYGTKDLAYSTMGGRQFREPALAVVHANGDMNTELIYIGHKTEQIGSENVTRTIINLKDVVEDLYVDIIYTAYKKENVIITNAVIRNGEKKDVELHNFYSSSLPLRADSYLLTHLYGAWAREAQVDHVLLTHGAKSIESRKLVRTTHTENPAFMLTLNSKEFSETSTEVIAGALAWSGNYKINFEMDEHNTLNVLAGMNPYASEYKLKKGESFTTPEMIYTYSKEGAGGASRNMHDWARNYGLWIGDKVAPTLLNSWEGAYFDFDTKTITGMIDDTADMGLELFVLDDGWFGEKYPRNSDKVGLGDWMLNTKKLPEGIDYLADYAHSKGVKFGIWIEPEMVNPKSALAEKHPNWVVKSGDREVTTIRNQWLLDLSNPKVQDFVFSVFDNTMKMSPNIDYIKWDANRHVENAGSEYLSTDEQSHFWIKYVQGFYSVMERVREKYPNVIIQACASGGGRVEYGAMKYFDEFWTSDNTEGLSRAKIQYGTSLFYPANVIGSHVSAVPNHQTKNITPLKFRFDIACTGRLGMELQPKKMTKDEIAFAKKIIANYKEYRDIIMSGDMYRVGTPYDDKGYYGILYVTKDKKRAVFFAYNIMYQGRAIIPNFVLPGLNKDLDYKITEQNIVKQRFWFNKKVISGDYLSEVGINMYLRSIYDSSVLLFEAQ